jgi:hypothetical protein
MPDASTPAAQNHLYLVDGSSYIFRAYHRLPPLTNRHGQPAGAVYGYTTMLWKLAGDLSKADGPTHMAVILDASEHTHRNEMYDQYKAHRPPPPEDLVPQFPLIRVATRAFSIPCIEVEAHHHRVVDGRDVDPRLVEHHPVIFEIVADLEDCRILQQRTQLREDEVGRQLIGRV